MKKRSRIAATIAAAALPLLSLLPVLVLPLLPVLASLAFLAPLAPLGAGPARAAVWDAAGAESLNVTIVGYYPVTSARHVWGCAAFVDETGHEYAIIGADSLHIVDLGDPSRPRRAAVLPPASPPTDNYYVHTSVRGRYAYAAGRFGPIKVVDLENPYAPVIAGEIPAIEFCACSCGHPCNNPSDPHQSVIETLFIDERGILYVTGIECGGGIHLYDLANPTDPSWLCHEHSRPEGTNWSRYAHDVHAWGGVLFVSRSRFPGIRWDIIDANPPCPTQPPGPCGNDHPVYSWITHGDTDLHSHSAWRLQQGPILLTADEEENGHVRVWDIANLSAPAAIGEFQPDGTCHSVHNIYSRGFGAQGDLCYAAWYNKGIQVFRLRDNDLQPYRVGYYEHPIRWRDLPGDDCCDPAETFPGTGPCYGVSYLDLSLPSGHFLGTELDGGLLVGRFLLSPAEVGEDGAGNGAPGGDEPGRPGGEIEVRGLPGSREVRILWRGAPSGAVGVEVLDAAGRVVRRLPAEGRDGPGVLELLWDGRDERGRALPGGVYFARALGAGAGGARGRIVYLP